MPSQAKPERDWTSVTPFFARTFRRASILPCSAIYNSPMAADRRWRVHIHLRHIFVTPGFFCCCFFVLQTDTVARCNTCDSLFHAKCVSHKSQRKAKVALAGSQKWRVDTTETSAKFVCPQVGPCRHTWAYNSSSGAIFCYSTIFRYSFIRPRSISPSVPIYLSIYIHIQYIHILVSFCALRG